MGLGVLDRQQAVARVDLEVVPADALAPALAVEGDAALEAVAAPARGRLQVNEDGVRAVVDLSPASPIRRQRSTSSSELWKPASKPPAPSKAARRTSMQAAVTACSRRGWETAGCSAGKPA